MPRSRHRGRALTYLLLVMKALIVILEVGHAFGFSGVVFGVGVCDVAGEDFLPEREAAGGAWKVKTIR